MNKCKCGCGEEVSKTWVRGHQSRGSNNPAWRGGRKVDKWGYVLLWVPRDHPFYCMANKASYIREHRLVMATHLRRPLTRAEEVHHKNEIPDDNRLENLEVMTRSEHALHHSDAIAITHCPRNHAYDKENTRIYRGHRHCRKCEKIHEYERTKKRSAERAERRAARGWKAWPFPPKPPYEADDEGRP